MCVWQSHSDSAMCPVRSPYAVHTLLHCRAAWQSNNRPDAVVADESWRGYQLRNRSFIVDTFTGLLKSHVKCNICGMESVTFDPFTSISLPIPINTKRTFRVRSARAIDPMPLVLMVHAGGGMTRMLSHTHLHAGHRVRR